METIRQSIIVDIDGTVALHPQRGHHDYHLVSSDEVNLPVAELVYKLAYDYHVIFVSGRPDSCREDTERWLQKYGLWRSDTELFMRKTGDYRPDDIVKREIYDKHIKEHGYNVAFVLDDRNRVVDMWRSLGLTCLQVAPGDF